MKTNLKDITNELRDRHVRNLTTQRDALLACVKTSLPVLISAEKDARNEVVKQTDPKRRSNWIFITASFKVDVDAARAAIALVEGCDE